MRWIVLLMMGLAFNGQANAEGMLEYKLTIKGGHFFPETVEVPAGVKFKLLITNQGPGPEEFESYELKKESVMGEGVTRPMVFAPLKPGTYPFFGEFHPETAKGRIIAK
ncbi:flagellar biosynthetic protein FliR [Novimethylophilus kurashikiensis]|uniref:Flagellar biosynthetic protein FliR n=1 Tax=Novimethylophilus kurashikiensis TaxID=1825523 RepID=A0A2R5F8X2_9PROT|nr:cupredoxin domain-containing protein [Novimethylophilus kurashikiensis]GBG13363.1 flagellar biosynthetic protein FliR [Novimethylophilus kurashikiensis]